MTNPWKWWRRRAESRKDNEEFFRLFCAALPIAMTRAVYIKIKGQSRPVNADEAAQLASKYAGAAKVYADAVRQSVAEKQAEEQTPPAPAAEQEEGGGEAVPLQKGEPTA